MSPAIGDLFLQHRSAGLLVDTNILLLYCVGRVRRPLISAFKRTEQFTPADFDRLLEVWRYFGPRVSTTPTVLAEVGNLLGQLAEPARASALSVLASAGNLVIERYTTSRTLMARAGFTRFGLADTAVEEAASNGLLVLSDDFKLTQYLTSVGAAAINFNHLRRLR